jgi:hypothetical protein
MYRFQSANSITQILKVIYSDYKQYITEIIFELVNWLGYA